MCERQNAGSDDFALSLYNVIKKISRLRRASLQRAREPGMSAEERAYFMAEANAYSVALDVMADEFGTETVWKMVE